MASFSCAPFCSGAARPDDLMVSQLILPIEPASRMTRDDFVVAPGNRHALAFLDAWPDWPMPAAALYGPIASGKTHLARIWAARADAAVTQARELRAPIPGPAVVENCDDVPDHAHESALFAMLERGTPLLLTGRSAPRSWPAGLPDLTSRFKALVAFELGGADEALLMALAVKLFADRQVQVPEAVVIELVLQLERSPAAIRDFIAKADAMALSLQKPINLQLIRGLMANPGVSS
jgi:chromosomal replication initiation ATPase DnaA